jgi:hypothetical protein
MAVTLKTSLNEYAQLCKQGSQGQAQRCLFQIKTMIRNSYSLVERAQGELAVFDTIQTLRFEKNAQYVKHTNATIKDISRIAALGADPIISKGTEGLKNLQAIEVVVKSVLQNDDLKDYATFETKSLENALIAVEKRLAVLRA